MQSWRAIAEIEVIIKLGASLPRLYSHDGKGDTSNGSMLFDYNVLAIDLKVCLET